MVEDLKGTFLEEDIEAQVKEYMRLISELDFDFNTTIHKRVEEPQFRTPKEQREWRLEEIRRCKEGHNGMTGKHYFYFNYCYIKSIGGGRIRPTWRRIDDDIFRRIEAHLRGDSMGRGMVTIKPRRIGASWMAASAILHECAFYSFSNIGVQSKAEYDVKRFLDDKVKFIYNNLPIWMKPSTDGGNSVLRMDFSKVTKDSKGNKIKSGSQSTLICKAPNDTSWEGEGLKMWVADEAGKVAGFLSILNMTLPCLAGEDGFTREGFPWAFGTVGDITSDGAGIKDLWYKSDNYDFNKHFIAGWMGKNLDKYGNENIEKTVREILTERVKKRGISEKSYYEYIQQYPLTADEAFMVSNTSFFDSLKISRRLMDLDPISESSIYSRGYFQWNVKGVSVIFRPHPEGKVIILERAKAGVVYSLGADPYDTKKEKGSDGSVIVLKPEMLVEDKDKLIELVNDETEDFESRKTAALALGYLPVCMYVDDGTDPEKYAEQSAMIAIHYNKSKILVEKNRGAGMIGWYERNNLRSILARKPKDVQKIHNKISFDIGYFRTAGNKEYDLQLTYDYHSFNINRIFFPELLRKMSTYDPNIQNKKADEVDGLAVCLVQYERIRKKYNFGTADSAIGSPVPSWDYKHTNGKIKVQ